MRHVATALLAVSLAACSSEPTLLDRYTTAIGGASAIEAVEGIRIEVEIAEPDFQLTGQYVAQRNGDMRIDVYDGDQRVFSEGLSDGVGWQMFLDGSVEPTSPDGTAALRRGLERNLFGLHEFAVRGHEVSAGEPQVIDGITYPVLDITMDDGFEERLYLDPQSFLPVRERSEFALHPDINPDAELHETRQSDFREIDGVVKSFLQETVDLRSGQTVQTIRIRQIELNPHIEAGFFDPPSGQ
ncbi:hypothetical protein [Maricaulis sp. CAU 1757]